MSECKEMNGLIVSKCSALFEHKIMRLINCLEPAHIYILTVEKLKLGGEDVKNKQGNWLT